MGSNDEAMEEDAEDNYLNCLFDKSGGVLEQFSCNDQPSVDQSLGLVRDCEVLCNDKEEVNLSCSQTCFFHKSGDVLEQFSCTDQPSVEQSLVLARDCTFLSNDNISDDKHLDSSDSYIDKEESLDCMSMSADAIVKTYVEEEIPVTNHGYNGIFSIVGDEANGSCCVESAKYFCLGSACPQHETAAGSSETPIASSSLSTQPGEEIEQNNHSDTENAMDPIEETVRNHLGVGAEEQDSSDGVKTDLRIQIQQTEESSCILVRQLPNVTSDRTMQVSVSSPFTQISGALNDGTCWQPVPNNEEGDDKYVDSIDSCIDQEKPLVGMSRPEDAVGKIDEQEKMPVTNHGCNVISSNETGEANYSCCLEGAEDFFLGSAGSQHENSLGSSTENVEIPIASSSLSTQPGEEVQQNNHNDAENAMDPLEETVRDHLGVAGEKQDFSDGGTTDLRIQIQHTEESPCILARQVPNVASDCTMQVSASSSFTQISGALNDSTCRQPVPNNQESDGGSGDPTCSNVADSSWLPDTEDKDSIKLDLVFVSTCSDVILSPPRRSTRRNKWCQKSETRRGKIVNKKLLQGELFLNTVRKKRSCLKQTPSSVWGSLDNLIQVKENEVTQKDVNHLLQIENQSSRKRRVGLGNGRRQKTHAGTLFTAKGKCSDSNDHTGRIDLTVKIGGKNGKRSLNVVESEVLHSPVSLLTVVGKCATKPVNSNSMAVLESENGIVNKLEDDLPGNRQFAYIDGDLESSVSYPSDLFLDALHVDKDLESTVTQDTSVGNDFGNSPRGYSHIGTEVLEAAIGKQYSDPGTSPDSEVISLTQDVSVGADTVLTVSPEAALADATASKMELASLKKQMKSSKLKEITDSSVESFSAEEKSLGKNKKNKSAKHRREEKVGRGCNPTDFSRLASNGNDSRHSSSTERHTDESTELGSPGRLLKMETITGSCEWSGQHVGVKSSEQLVTRVLLDTSKTMGLKPSSKSSIEVRKKRSAAPVSASNRRKNGCEHRKEDSRQLVNQRKVKEKDSLVEVVHNEERHLEAGCGITISLGTREQLESQGPTESSKDETAGIKLPNDPGISVANNFTSEDLCNSSALSCCLNGQLLPLPDAWVCCDDCCKWRCISTALADSIEATNCRWTCNDNLDKAFGDCSIPQEKSNAEINAELELPELYGEEDASYARPIAKGFESKKLTVPQQAPWKPIESNMFLHRSRKTQTIDEIMICHCKTPLDGGLGCGDECLNRMLNIECVRGTCPCGDRCSNQQFQKRKYAKLEYFPCGKKGYGLQLLEKVSEGDFLIEYVGEVLDLNAHEARQREYASRGQKHFYFMTLNGSEVIDACAKGNLGRFINHSCNPNCRTEKWMVNGEVCIGLFAMRNIKKGEEVTFDYNYVRVFGAAAKKCVCGSSACRGYIGGDPLNTDVVVQEDSDEEYPEPVMVEGDGVIEEVKGTITSDTLLSDGQQLQHTDPMVISASSLIMLGSSVGKEETSSRSGGVVPVEISPPKESIINKSLSDVQPPDMSIQTEDVMNKISSSIYPLEVSLLEDNVLSKNLSTIHLLATNEKSVSDKIEHRPNISKARSHAKSSRPSTSIKKGKCRLNTVVASKLQVLAIKPKKVLGSTANSGPKGVEEKLNELLDTDGGISKRTDATTGYLKLLFVTASFGDNINGEAAQSTRELSIILDALLKTKKRKVLKDIISKNGLQMLHNIMKQNRKNFNKTPIIRKLLKILEYLAEKDILTLELINSGPPCTGMESFRESIFQLARHSDLKVHQTARDFRDKWMPRSFRRTSYSDRDDSNVEQQGGLHSNRLPTYKRWCDHDSKPMPNIDSQTTFGATPLYDNIEKDRSGPSTNSYPANGTRTRKRKSRWDQPQEGKSRLISFEVMEDQKLKQELQPSLQQPDIREAELVDKVKGEIIFHGSEHNVSKQAENASSVDAMQLHHDDSPPGFPSLPLVRFDASSTATLNLLSDTHQRKCSCEVVTGCYQERYISHLPVSYGVPLFFVDQLGTPQAETMDSWEISPGLPFHPFPPLPPYPRESRNTLPPCALMRTKSGESQRDNHRASHHQPDAGVPSTSGTRPPEVANTGSYNQKVVEGMRSSSGNLGRRYFRQQKLNNAWGPPWVRNRIGRGFKESN